MINLMQVKNLDKYYEKGNYQWVLKSGASRPPTQDSSCFQ